MKPLERAIGVRTYLLLELARGPGYGADLIARVARRTEKAIRPRQATVYPELKHLEWLGWVDAMLERRPPEDRRGGRPRRIYTLTKKGHVEVRRLVWTIQLMIGGLPE